MKQEQIEKQLISNGGNTRITIFNDMYAESPRDLTDEPLHCEDWSRDYSIMNKHERETKSEDTGKLIRYLLARYGDNKKIVKLLKDNYKGSEHERYENGLSYDRSRKEWIVWSWQPSWQDYHGNVYEAHWGEEWSFSMNIHDLDIYNITDVLSDETIAKIAHECMTDEVKIASYNFSYYGQISFSDDYDCESDGICWLEKDEFLKYSGCTEEYWNGKSLDEIEWLLDELVAWSDNEVYGFIVEESVNYKTTRKCLSGNAGDEEYEETEWEELDSCSGFYGELSKVGKYIFEYAGLDEADFKEVV